MALTLDALSDDVEPLPMILSHLKSIGRPTTTDEVSVKVAGLIQTGFVDTHGTDPTIYAMTSGGCEKWEELSRL